MFSLLLILTLLVSNFIFMGLYYKELKSHKKTLDKYSPKISPRNYDSLDVDFWGNC